MSPEWAGLSVHWEVASPVPTAIAVADNEEARLVVGKTDCPSLYQHGKGRPAQNGGSIRFQPGTRNQDVAE